jgi:hypothetical protein
MTNFSSTFCNSCFLWNSIPCIGPWLAFVPYLNWKYWLKSRLYACAVFFNYVRRIFKNIFDHAEQISKVRFFFNFLLCFDVNLNIMNATWSFLIFKRAIWWAWLGIKYIILIYYLLWIPLNPIFLVMGQIYFTRLCDSRAIDFFLNMH